MSKPQNLQKIGNALNQIINHNFDVIEETEPGKPSPIEALSGDHMIGIYFDIIPRKMREKLSGFKKIEIHDLLPQKDFLEAEKMRGCRFQAADLQYLETDWTAYTDEVKYKTLDVLGCAHYIKKEHGNVYIYLNDEIPMPLWLRSVPLGEPLSPEAPQIVIQAMSLDKPIFTNIHTEMSVEYARLWAEDARGYYKTEGWRVSHDYRLLKISIPDDEWTNLLYFYVIARDGV